MRKKLYIILFTLCLLFPLKCHANVIFELNCDSTISTNNKISCYLLGKTTSSEAIETITFDINQKNMTIDSINTSQDWKGIKNDSLVTLTYDSTSSIVNNTQFIACKIDMNLTTRLDAYTYILTNIEVNGGAVTSSIVDSSSSIIDNPNTSISYETILLLFCLGFLIIVLIYLIHKNKKMVNPLVLLISLLFIPKVFALTTNLTKTTMSLSDVNGLLVSTLTINGSNKTVVDENTTIDANYCRISFKKPSDSGSSSDLTSSSNVSTDKIFTGYWQNWNTTGETMKLREVPSGYDIVALAFAYTTSENTGTGTVTFTPDTSVTSVSEIKSDIAILHSRGQKVVISVGGETGTVLVNSTTTVNNFVTSVKAIIDEYDLDGIDINIEKTNGVNSENKPAYLATALRTLKNNYGSDFIITLAPETYYFKVDSTGSNPNGFYYDLIISIKDIVTIVNQQLYNSGTMYGPDGGVYTQGTIDFAVALSINLIKAGLPASKVGLGIISYNSNNGYMNPSDWVSAMNVLTTGTKLSSMSYNITQAYDIGGFMIWSINIDTLKNNKSFYNEITGDETTTNMSGTIFLGDSRTNALSIYNVINSSEKVYATDGATIANINDHVSSMNAYLLSNSSSSYNIVLNYGVNDYLMNPDYLTAYDNIVSSLDTKHKIYVVSVNPVNDDISAFAKNASIATFNSTLSNHYLSSTRVKYCDIYGSTSLTNWLNYISTDGIHYTNSGYQYIYNKIKTCISDT